MSELKNRVLQLLQETDGSVSGQELSARFGVSRTAVWKVIRQLQEEGYTIEAVRSRGYRMVVEPDWITQERIRSFLRTDWAANELLILNSVDSTNNEAKRRAEDGAKHGLLVIGEQQTAGKGRRGRVWESPAGTGIFMSLLMRPDFEPSKASMLTLVMALAVHSAIERVAGIHAEIKWPNDIVSNGRKVCGILTEMSAQMDYINHIVIGIGINVHNEEFPKELSHMATSVFKESGARICRAQLIAETMNCFEYYYAAYLERMDLSLLQAQYDQCLVNRGRQVRVLDPKGSYIGMAEGISPEGELLVETENGLRRVSSGEVSVRGVYGYV